MTDFTAIFIIGIITLGIYRLFELFVRRNERLAIIDKVGDKIQFADISASDLNLPFFGKVKYSSWALKISLLMIGVGLGSIVAFTIQMVMIDGQLISQNDWNLLNRFEGMIYFSCVAIFGGIGLLIAYLIEMKHNKTE